MRYPFYKAVVLIFGVVALGTQGCGPKPAGEALERTVRKVPAEPPVPAMRSLPEKPTEAAVWAKEEFEHTLHQNLERLDEEIRELKIKVANLEESGKAEWTGKMTDLDAKRKTAESKLDEIQKSSGEAWKHLRDGAHKAKEELEQAVKEAVKEF